MRSRGIREKQEWLEKDEGERRSTKWTRSTFECIAPEKLSERALWLNGKRGGFKDFMKSSPPGKQYTGWASAPTAVPKVDTAANVVELIIVKGSRRA